MLICSVCFSLFVSGAPTSFRLLFATVSLWSSVLPGAITDTDRPQAVRDQDQSEDILKTRSPILQYIDPQEPKRGVF